MPEWMLRIKPKSKSRMQQLLESKLANKLPRNFMPMLKNSLRNKPSPLWKS